MAPHLTPPMPTGDPMEGVLSFTVTYDPTQNTAYLQHLGPTAPRRLVPRAPHRQDGSALGDMELVHVPMSNYKTAAPTTVVDWMEEFQRRDQELESQEHQICLKFEEFNRQRMVENSNATLEARIVTKLQEVWKTEELRRSREEMDTLRAQLAAAMVALQEQRLRQAEGELRVEEQRLRFERELEERRQSVLRLETSQAVIKILEQNVVEERQGKASLGWSQDLAHRERRLREQIIRLRDTTQSVAKRLEGMEAFLRGPSSPTAQHQKFPPEPASPSPLPEGDNSPTGSEDAPATPVVPMDRTEGKSPSRAHHLRSCSRRHRLVVSPARATALLRRREPLPQQRAGRRLPQEGPTPLPTPLPAPSIAVETAALSGASSLRPDVPPLTIPAATTASILSVRRASADPQLLSSARPLRSPGRQVSFQSPTTSPSSSMGSSLSTLSDASDTSTALYSTYTSSSTGTGSENDSTGLTSSSTPLSSSDASSSDSSSSAQSRTSRSSLSSCSGNVHASLQVTSDASHVSSLSTASGPREEGGAPLFPASLLVPPLPLGSVVASDGIATAPIKAPAHSSASSSASSSMSKSQSSSSRSGSTSGSSSSGGGTSGGGGTSPSIASSRSIASSSDDLATRVVTGSGEQSLTVSSDTDASYSVTATSSSGGSRGFTHHSSTSPPTSTSSSLSSSALSSTSSSGPTSARSGPTTSPASTSRSSQPRSQAKRHAAGTDVAGGAPGDTSPPLLPPLTESHTDF
eukprot:GGOE01002324.1.p1 GENE.GGOE01002324.1~~GGOE01002324.1.p1  ORF type:complete len:763 (+),score=158.48 GGOE01002324.1:43-2289(+)